MIGQNKRVNVYWPMKSHDLRCGAIFHKFPFFQICFKNPIPEIWPDSFKRTIAQCKGDFAGTKQQDAQELLIFLLDGLHEDLNKVKERRYIEEKVKIIKI